MILVHPCKDTVSNEPKNSTNNKKISTNQAEDGPTKVCINMFIRSISKIDDVVMVRHLFKGIKMLTYLVYIQRWR